jgi:hypothetical protein
MEARKEPSLLLKISRITGGRPRIADGGNCDEGAILSPLGLTLLPQPEIPNCPRELWQYRQAVGRREIPLDSWKKSAWKFFRFS